MSYGEDRDGVFKHVLCKVRCQDGVKTVRYKFYYATQGSLPENPDTWVHCSCANFKFVLETSLTYHGSSDIKDSNGNFPRIKNPEMEGHLCKHLVCMASKAKMRKGKKEDSDLEKLRNLRAKAWSEDRYFGNEGINVNTVPKRFQKDLKTRRYDQLKEPKRQRQLKNAPRFRMSGPGVGMIRTKSKYPSPLNTTKG